MGATFECEIQARLRDVNLGGHVDNVEALRVLDEARLLFFRWAPLAGDERPGLFREVPSGIVELVGLDGVTLLASMSVTFNSATGALSVTGGATISVADPSRATRRLAA